jgi:hypothetical protein
MGWGWSLVIAVITSLVAPKCTEAWSTTVRDRRSWWYRSPGLAGGPKGQAAVWRAFAVVVLRFDERLRRRPRCRVEVS